MKSAFNLVEIFHHLYYLQLSTPYLRFFQSLRPKVESGDDEPSRSQILRSSFLRKVGSKDAGNSQPENPSSSSHLEVINFSWESLLEFQNDNLIHTSHLAADPGEPRQRPNYDSRKRKFMARYVERRKFLRQRFR